jgi:hypothetical protein
MPNCDFYATPEDHAELLAWLFAETGCRVFELYSDFGKPLREFESPQGVLSQFQRCYSTGAPWDTVCLQLFVVGAGPAFFPRRIDLNPKYCEGATFRFVAEGWGLIQLYLSDARIAPTESSHTNHNSKKRAEAWAPTSDNPAGPAEWDFERITSFSSRLNRQIKKRAVGKLGSRPVLPGAMKVWQSGLPLSPFKPERDTMTVI